jgi:hypothetical protein
MPRGGATVSAAVSERARRRESVGTDSRVLRRREAVNAPAKPFCAKFFCPVNWPATTPRIARKLRAKDVARARRQRSIAKSESRETRISSALSRGAVFCARNRDCKNIFNVSRRQSSPRAAAAQAARGTYTQN